ncbi:MAG: type II CAAX endopeptidase family protein [Minisyncoccia bacterium]
MALLYGASQLLGLDYQIKTFLKVFLFLLVPLSWSFFLMRGQTERILGLKDLKLKSLVPGLVVGTGSFGIILAAYAILGNFIDFTGIKTELQTTGITTTNFILIGLYIVFINSLLEEFFFRGFLFLNLKKYASVRIAYFYSAILFAIYHLETIQTWFNPVLMFLALLSLFVIGLVFNFLNIKANHFLNSWIAHAVADSAIILVGCRMFGLI